MVRQTLLQVILFFMLFGITSWATIINVPGDQSTIQSGMDAAVPGDTVLVAPDRYFENIDYRGKDIVVASFYILDNDESFISSTIIDGSNPIYPIFASCVSFKSGETRDAILEGFTLTGGTGTWIVDSHAGGYYREGGGVVIDNSSPTIRHNRIIDNEAINTESATSAGGGGLRCEDGDPLIEYNLISQNEALYGAGIVMYFAGGIVRNNIIVQNSGGQDYNGGGIWVNGNPATVIENNVIADNHSFNTGGGISIFINGTLILRNDIIWGNTAQNGYPQVSPIGDLDVACCNIEGGFAGTNIIDYDPMFCDPENGNYSIDYLSPCAADHPFNTCGELIGAYEPACQNCPDSDDDGLCLLLDNCPDVANLSQEDGDEDGIGDACDNCLNDSNAEQADSDVDGVGDICDNCPEHNNPGQEDSNGNDVGDLCDYTCGDADGDYLINILDVVYLLNSIYKSGSDPEPPEAADVNHDYLLNILDVVYLINSIYKDGAVPECVIW